MSEEKEDKKKTGKRRSNGQLARDRRIISRYYNKGMLQADIAVKLQLSPATISNDIKHLQGRWLKRADRNFDKAKARELAKIDNLELEYWDAWAHSKKDRQVVTKKAVKGDGKINARQEGTERSEGQSGDPRFLAGVQWCINKRCQIRGFDAPTEIRIPGAVKAYIGISPDDWDEPESDVSDGKDTDA